jgi:aminoglycoside phosphotransferase
MLTQEQLHEEQEAIEGRRGEARMMTWAHPQDMKVPRILTHNHLDRGQRRMSWTWILTRTRR